MPLGICAPCQCAYIYEDAPDNAGERCPRCGATLRMSPVRDLADLPPWPLSLPTMNRNRREPVPNR